MESDSEPTASLILPVVFNFSKRLDSMENFDVAIKAVKLCKDHLSNVDERKVREYVDEVFEIFKVAFEDMKKKYLYSHFYDTLAIATMLDPRLVNVFTF